MLQKQNRLSKNKDVTTASRRGRSFFSSYLAVKYLKAVDKTRITVVVSTKVSKKAVVRNRLKRIIRDLLRKNLASLKTGDYVIIVKPQATKLEPSALREQALDLFTKTHLL